MFGWRIALVAAASAAILLTLLMMLIFRRCYHSSKRGTKVSEAATTQNKGIMEGLQSQRISKIQSRTRPSYNLFRTSKQPLFSWADHPSLITDAIENGWSRFAFTNYSSCPSTTRTSFLAFVGDVHNQRETQAETTWEVRGESAELMQKIKINPGLKKLTLNSSSTAAKSVLRTALPLPGPSIGNPSSFPQEAYFEIIILSVSTSREDKTKGEGEKTKLIEEKKSAGKGNLDALDEIKTGEGAAVMISVGLTCSSLLPLKIPGSYHGSIGFHFDGSVYLDGIKLAYESEKEEWGQEEKVIGCGYDPKQKKVFFTVDSKLVHVVHCKSEEFGTPLYPVIAANAEMTVVVNMGQSGFFYGPANELRTPNPCFSGPLLRSRAALGYEDSGELFSMGRIDSGWHHHCTTESSTNGSRVNEEDDESDADLFEIVLDVNGESVNV